MSAAQEQQIGQQEHPQHPAAVRRRLPGRGAPGLRPAGRRPGGRGSDQPDAEFTFTLLDSEVPNAFALPGGYVYITRGLLALAETEAELAGVLATRSATSPRANGAAPNAGDRRRRAGHARHRRRRARRRGRRPAGAAGRRRRAPRPIWRATRATRSSRPTISAWATSPPPATTRTAMATFLENRREQLDARDRRGRRRSGPLRAGSRPTREPSTGCSARPTRPKPRRNAADARDGRNTWPRSTV